MEKKRDDGYRKYRSLNIANTLFGHSEDCSRKSTHSSAGCQERARRSLLGVPMNTFLEMVVDVFKKEEFRGFIGVVSRLIK